MDGERFGLLEVLGRGAFGQVIKAVDKRRDHRVVALKIVPVPNDEAGKLRLQREASNLAKLNGHPNIVALHESFECMPGPSLCLVLDCLEGVTLAQQIERHGALKEEAGREVASQLASALTFMHSRGIVHRDLKADNIMSTRKCDAARAHWVLLDFGFSRSTVPALDTQLSLVGSEDWLAPEVHSLVRMSKAEKKPAFEDMLGAISPAVDCYALGLVMRYALTGGCASSFESFLDTPHCCLSSSFGGQTLSPEALKLPEPHGVCLAARDDECAAHHKVLGCCCTAARMAAIHTESC